MLFKQVWEWHRSSKLSFSNKIVQLFVYNGKKNEIRRKTYGSSSHHSCHRSCSSHHTSGSFRCRIRIRKRTCQGKLLMEQYEEEGEKNDKCEREGVTAYVHRIHHLTNAGPCWSEQLWINFSQTGTHHKEQSCWLTATNKMHPMNKPSSD